MTILWYHSSTDYRQTLMPFSKIDNQPGPIITIHENSKKNISNVQLQAINHTLFCLSTVSILRNIMTTASAIIYHELRVAMTTDDDDAVDEAAINNHHQTDQVVQSSSSRSWSQSPFTLILLANRDQLAPTPSNRCWFEVF